MSFVNVSQSSKSTSNDEDNECNRQGNEASKRRRIDDLSINVSTLGSVPLFTEHKYIGAFETNQYLEMEMLDEVTTKYLNLPKQLKALNISLDGGYEDSLLIDHHLGEKDGYNIYRRAKFEHFLRWILNKNYVTKCEKRKKPIFLAFSEVLAGLLTTPFQGVKDWVVHDVRYKDFIVVEKIKSPSAEKAREVKKQFHSQRGAAFNDKCFYHGEKFYQLFTVDSKQNLNEELWRCLLKQGVDCYKGRRAHVFEAQFGSRSLLCVHDLQAVDANDDSKVEFRVIKTPTTPRAVEHFRNNISLDVWGKCVAAGVNKVVCGERSFSKKSAGFLEQIKVYTIRDLELLEGDWKPDVCYDFLDRLLTYIEENVSAGNNSQVFQLKWELSRDERDRHRVVRDTKVTCQQFTESSFVPSWFSDKLLNHPN